MTGNESDKDDASVVPLRPKKQVRGRGNVTSVNNEDAANRANRALELRLAGVTFRQIADSIGYSSPASAYKAVSTALQRDADALADQREDYRQLHIARSERLLRGVWPAAVKGEDLKATEVALRIMERQARLLGLDAPVKVEVSQATTQEIDALLDEMTRIVDGTVLPNASGD